MQRAPAREQFEGLAQGRYLAGEAEKMSAIQAQRFDRGARSNGRSAHAALEQCALAKLVARCQSIEGELVAAGTGLEHASAAADKHKKSVGGIALAHDHFTEFEAFLGKALAQLCVMRFRHETHECAIAQHFQKSWAHGSRRRRGSRQSRRR